MSNDKVAVRVVKREDAVGASWLDKKGEHVTEKRPKGQGIGWTDMDGTHYKDGKRVWPSENPKNKEA